jgi:hypothetical protein
LRIAIWTGDTRDGDKPTAGVMTDTINMTRYSTVEIDFVADDPGTSLQHLLSGRGVPDAAGLELHELIVTKVKTLFFNGLDWPKVVVFCRPQDRDKAQLCAAGHSSLRANMAPS